MKKLIRSLVIVAVAALAIVSCKNDKTPGNSKAVNQFVESHSYVCALADNADLLAKIDIYSILDDTALMTDPAFESLRAELFEDAPEGMEACFRDPSLAGLDAANPVLVSVSNVDPDEGADVFITISLSDREKFVTLINSLEDDEDEIALVKDEDGYYVNSDDELAIVVGEKAMVAYIPIEKKHGEKEVLARAKAAIAKTSLLASLPGMEAFFTGEDDLAVWGNNERFYELSRSELDKDLRKELGLGIEDLLGGDPAKGTASLMTLNFRPGELAMDTKNYGENKIADRLGDWFGKPNMELLNYIPESSDVAGLIAFHNLSDAAAFAQDIMDKVPDLQGFKIKDLLPTVGLAVEDLDSIGTIAAGADVDTETVIVVAEVGEKIGGALGRTLGMAGMSSSSRNGWSVYNLDSDFRLLLGNGRIVLCSSKMASQIAPSGYSGGLVFNSNPLSKDLVHGIVADLNAPAIQRMIAEQLPEANDYIASVRLNFPGDKAASLVLELDQKHVNAAKAVLLLCQAYLENQHDRFNSDYEEDAEWSDYDFLMEPSTDDMVNW